MGREIEGKRGGGGGLLTEYKERNFRHEHDLHSFRQPCSYTIALMGSTFPQREGTKEGRLTAAAIMPGMVHAVRRLVLVLVLVLALLLLLRPAAVSGHEVASNEVPVRFGRRPAKASRMSREMTTHYPKVYFGLKLLPD